MNELEFIETLKVLEIQPNDILVLKCKDYLTDSQIAILTKITKSHINNKVMILEGDIDIGVLRPVKWEEIII
jgi:hypothetical protein